jgi:DNA topoisomerase-1
MNKDKSKSKTKTKKKSVAPKYKYLDENDNVIKDKAEIARLNAIGVPPGYHNVLLSDNPKSAILAIGLDDRQRAQYVYNPKVTKKNSVLKYENVVTLGKQITKIRSDIRRILLALHKQPFNSWEQPRAMTAIIVYFIDNCNFRVGNIKYAIENGTYGCTTLCRKHVKLDVANKCIHFKFIGKKGVVNEGMCKDELIFIVMKKLLANRKGYLFVTDDENTPVSSEEIQKFLKTYDEAITPKMFRTWNANYHFIEKLRKDITANNELLNDKKTKAKYINECCDHVSDQLHNTASVSKENYVSSALIERFMKGNGLMRQLESPKYKTLTTDEILLRLM